MIASFGARPNPSQTTRSTAITGMGTAWEATSTGYTARRAAREKCRPTARANPASSATRMPRATSPAVTRKLSHSSARSRTSAAATSVGAGSTRSSTAPPRA